MSAELGAAPDRALARVDLSAIERNCARLREAIGPGAALCAVVKADGYGHGAGWVAGAALAGGATWLAVATAVEAEELRRHQPHSRILVMGALTREELELALEADADVVAWEEGFVEWVERRVAAVPGARARVHVKLDTGMGRLGTKDAGTARRVIERIAAAGGLEPAGLMTHLATADEQDPAFMQEQLALFAPLAAEVKRSFPDAVVHAGNSAAALAEPASRYDMARCGVAVYGMDPFQRDPAEHGLEPALALESVVAAVKRFEPGHSAGYGRTWTATEPTCLGVLPIGYGDGFRRGLSNRGAALIGGRRYPLVGTVSMDNVTVDLGPSPSAAVGDRAILIGSQGSERILAEELARALDTINYEVSCGISPRVRRLYHRDSGRAA